MKKYLLKKCSFMEFVLQFAYKRKCDEYFYLTSDYLTKVDFYEPPLL